MGFTEKELLDHCQTIVKSSRVRNKIVVLCEGGRLEEFNTRRSPSAYRQLSKVPDANFYKACIPVSWKNKRPEFFNSGSRADVLKTYFKLIELRGSKENGFLNPNLLFALVDVDIQNADLHNYHLPDIHAVYSSLYSDSGQSDTIEQKHKIWTTGLIHKEAYFLLPELQSVFDQFPNPITLNNKKLVLEDLYKQIASESSNDRDLEVHFENIKKRLGSLKLNNNSVSTWKDDWLKQFSSSRSEEEKVKLVYALFSIRKAKEYWAQISTEEKRLTTEQLRDQLTLQIGSYFSKSKPAPYNHIANFFAFLKRFAK
ncbi:MAG: hypothetical protein F6K17_38640 [Okeania sp. SIO3C4]|nr:hypothetical protein [Okeania sp. SIO3C4]